MPIFKRLVYFQFATNGKSLCCKIKIHHPVSPCMYTVHLGIISLYKYLSLNSRKNFSHIFHYWRVHQRCSQMAGQQTIWCFCGRKEIRCRLLKIYIYHVSRWKNIKLTIVTARRTQVSHSMHTHCYILWAERGRELKKKNGNHFDMEEKVVVAGTYYVEVRFKSFLSSILEGYYFWGAKAYKILYSPQIIRLNFVDTNLVTRQFFFSSLDFMGKPKSSHFSQVQSARPTYFVYWFGANVCDFEKWKKEGSCLSDVDSSRLTLQLMEMIGIKYGSFYEENPVIL